MNLEIINPINYPNWDELLLASGDHSFFHTSAWARVLAESYNYKPLYFTEIVNDRLSVLLPVMEVESFLTGKRGVSLPFTDFCPPVVPDSDSFKDAMKDILDYGKNAGWKYFDFRGGEENMVDVIPSLSHYTHDLNLQQDEEQIFNNFKGNTRRNIRKAIKEGVEVRVDNSFESVKEFFRLNCMTRKRHGLPPQPFRFFENIYKHVISDKKGFTSIAIFKKKIIAGAVFFQFNKDAIFKYGASDMNYSRLRPNNLVMWEAIRWYINHGFENLSFGLTYLENQGLLQFKRSWGTTENLINHYKFDHKKSTFVRDEFRAKLSYPFFRNMPAPLLNLTGALIYKHFG